MQRFCFKSICLRSLCIISLLATLFLACKAQPQHTAVRMPDNESDTLMLVGTASLDSLAAAPYDGWYEENREGYEPSPEKIEALKPLLKKVRIQVFLGTWCKDSKREVPRFTRILEEAGYDPSSVEVIAVNREKQTPQEYEAGMSLINVPTFIFYKKGEELGRIVEFPVEDLESDMLKILSGEPYRHAYDWD